MRYIKKKGGQIFIIWLTISLSGCFKGSNFWLYNLSGKQITVFYTEQKITINSGEGSLLEYWGSKKNTLEPYNLKLEFDEGAYCYTIPFIKSAGYGEYNKSNKLVFRYKLDKNKSISVYKVNGEFSMNNEVGVQPKGYPVSPEKCKRR